MFVKGKYHLIYKGLHDGKILIDGNFNGQKANDLI